MTAFDPGTELQRRLFFEMNNCQIKEGFTGYFSTICSDQLEVRFSIMASTSDFPFTFDPAACEACGGQCCRWGGYVWVTEADIQAMAEIMKMDLEAFANEYVRAAYGKLSLQERLRDGEYHCCLFDPFRARCLVYEARPEQCRTFPFWDQYRENYRKLLEYCPGVKVKDKSG